MCKNGFTVKDLRDELAGLPDSAELLFDGGLRFGRLKRLSDNEWVILFDNLQVELTPSAKAAGVLVAFTHPLPLDGMMKEVKVPRY